MSFTLDLSKAVENIKEDAEKVVRGTLFGITNKIILRTPVGNPSTWKSKPPKGYRAGTLRGAWQASINTPDKTKTNKVDKNGGQTVSAAQAVISGMKLGQRFYLTNPQPYALRVEFGWSKQAPSGMVRRSVAEYQQIINNL